METKLEKQARYLKTYILAATLFCGAFLLTNFSLQSRRIIIDCVSLSEKNGKMTMILTILSERKADRKETGTKTEDVLYPGMLFYN